MPRLLAFAVSRVLYSGFTCELRFPFPRADVPRAESVDTAVSPVSSEEQAAVMVAAHVRNELVIATRTGCWARFVRAESCFSSGKLEGYVKDHILGFG